MPSLLNLIALYNINYNNNQYKDQFSEAISKKRKKNL